MRKQIGGDDMTAKKFFHMAAFILVVVGAIDLGLFGIIPVDANGEGFDLIGQIFGFNKHILELVYALIGVSGIALLITHTKDCKICDTRRASAKVE